MKKFLSMALALAMVFTMFTFAAGSAGATDFNDVPNDSEFKEAVDVITAIGIMGGYGNGQFGPNEYLSRGAAAKIIAGLRLTPTTAETLPRNVSPFPDVPANDEFAGYVTYVRDEGIVGGYSDGTFQPRARLSGYAFLKMLLGALGYRSDVEGFGSGSWTVNVAKVANDAEILDGVDGQISSAGMTRGVATQLILNVLKADLVEYESTTNVTIENVTVNVGNNKAIKRTTTEEKGKYIKDDRVSPGSNLRTLQFAEQYFQRLRRDESSFTDANGQDEFGRPTTTWTWRNEEVGKYADAPDKVYFGNFKPSNVYRDLNLNNSYTFLSNGQSLNGTARRAVQLVNGVVVDMVDTTLSRSNTKDLNERIMTPYGNRDANGNEIADGYFNAQIGNGAVTYVYFDDDDEQMIISTMIYYSGKISNIRNATSSADRSVDLELAPSRQTNAHPYSVKDGKRITNYTKYETDNFRKDDIVWYTFCSDDGEIKDMGTLEAISGTVTRYVLDGSIRLRAGGSTTDYNYAKAVAFMGDLKDDVNITGLGSENFETDSEATLYIIRLNNSPYILWVDGEGSSNVSEYVLIRNTDKDSLSGDLRARLLFSDGTQRTVDVDGEIRPENRAKYPNASADPDRVNQDSYFPVVARYSERSDGTYRLTTIPTIDNPNGIATGNRFFDGLLNVSGNSVTGDALGGLSPDSSTVFVVLVSGNYRVYTGYRNLPTINNRYAFVYANGNDVKLVFVTDDTQTTINSKDLIFISATSASGVYNDNGDYYRTYAAIVDNRVTEVMVQADPATTLFAPVVGNAYRYQNGYVNNGTTSQTSIVGYEVQDFVVDRISKRDDADKCIILNNTDTDDDIISSGYYSSSDVRIERAYGYDSPSGDEIKLNTHVDANGNVNTQGGAHTWYVSPDVRVYEIDGSDIERIAFDSLGSDNDDWVYLAYDERDAEITYLFIVKHED